METTLIERPFLSAAWTDLVFLNFYASMDLLKPHLPLGLELDLYDGRPVISLVAFRFLRTRILGFKPPWGHSFAELNLRMYVRDPVSGLPGVVFLNEICPYRIVSLVAKLLYREHLKVLPCAFNSIDGQYQYQFGKASADYSNRLTIIPKDNLSSSLSGHFIVERYHGYAKWSSASRLHYQVDHEPWPILAAELIEFDLDFNSLYGKELAQIFKIEPLSILYSPGSTVTLSFGVKERISQSLGVIDSCTLTSHT